MEFNIGKVRSNVQHLVSLIVSNDLRLYLETFLNKKIYIGKDIEDLLQCLSHSMLDEALTIPIATAFEDCLLLLITNAVAYDEDKDINFVKYQWKCIALAKLMHMSICAKRYALSYFCDKPSPFSSSHDLVAKKTKNDYKSKPEAETVIKCCFYLLKADVVFFKGLWNWSEFLNLYVDHSDSKPTVIKLYINHIIAMLTNMSALKIRKLNRDIPEEFLIAFDEEQMSLNVPHSIQYDENSLIEVSDKTIYVNVSSSSLVTNIEGVLLPIFNKDNYEFYCDTEALHDSIVRVDSTKVNLRSIALGIAAGKAICLSGPVGCGKTTLVEYLARKTGRIIPKRQDMDDELAFFELCKNNHKMLQKINAGTKRKTENSVLELEPVAKSSKQRPPNGFLRIQLGDQTDSKMLLGQYHCTDVPGEFIWLPGVLTQAVMNGYWLLLEDLDCATTDTFTVLSSLLENNYLSVPGFRDCVKIVPGFQLFVTVRTHKGSSSNSAQKALFSLLEKYMYTINILPLSRNELCKVISTNFTQLSTVANRIVDVFLTFSSGDHNVADNLRFQETDTKVKTNQNYNQLPYEEISVTSVTNSGRLVSTRDLIKLCHRSSPTFSVTSSECAYFVFQNAVDIFCSYLPHSKEKTKLITSIGAQLGIIQSRCEYYAEEYKPEVQTDNERIKVGRAELITRSNVDDTEALSLMEPTEEHAFKRLKLSSGERQITLKQKSSGVTFSFTRLASCILERIAICVANAEPVLLVGETGVGKTSSVQYLAAKTKHKLVVVNMNNQSDVSDLVGGFKPVDLTYVIAPLRIEFELLFRQVFNQSKNESFLSKFSICYNQGNFLVIAKLMLKVANSVFEKSERNELRDKDLLFLPRWMALKLKLQKLCNQLSKSINISFAFIPGSLVNCIKNGDWVLLDEINLASAETLECLSTILEPDGSVVLLEKGDFTPVKRHPDFRIFACMNPNTDIGKKDLSVGIRNRFTEFFVDEVETEADLSLLISDYLSATGIQRKSVMNIVRLYKRLKQLAKLELNDGLGNRPVYSLRTLCRSLQICAKNLCGSIERNLYESFCLSFLTQLDPPSHNIVLHLIKEAMLSNAKAALKQGIPKPGEGFLDFEGYWIEQGPNELQSCSNYILTDSVKENLRDLSRIISIGKLPILLQGPTSAGKTSLIEYVARRSGNHCLRINNHEHTDLQEYIGTYTADIMGKLVFKEGVLVQAMRNGYWIILDELNLASTEILEALNRVLDDNRELFIPETQTLVKAHPNFMLFATQNPPGLYGGRKTLSRAFKNRFIELHFSDIPRNELEIILEKKCLIPASYAKKMVACMVDLQQNRKPKNVFTLRDLFRWGIRYTLADKKLLDDLKYDWNQHLIEEGYLVLSAKVRTEVELEIIEEALYKNFKKRIDLNVLFDANTTTPKSAVTKDIIEAIQNFKLRSDIVWTHNMSRMAVLTAKALQFDEPVLLVGPTGCGKTTVCQLLSTIRGVNLRILNCHMHTEGADFLGGLRPCRQSDDDVKSKKLFEWADGPLIQAMTEGSYFMADEISLAEDSVLERLNCILEPERTVLLAEKCGVTDTNESEKEITKEFVVQAKAGFQFLATMNPGGDFGKKELSPALRNRFTEIWCQPSDTRDDLIQIASSCIFDQLKMMMSLDKTEILKIATYIVEIVLFMKTTIEKFKYSIRDILAMANYIVKNEQLSFPEKAIFGLETIFLDALEMTSNDGLENVAALKTKIIKYAIEQADVIMSEKFTLSELLENKGTTVEFTANSSFGIKPFFINASNSTTNDVMLGTSETFLFDAPTTKQNLFRLLSALSLEKPILLEGPPGVGKTSIVENIARSIGFNFVRINLCEHTDLADLFGTDLPVEDNFLNSSSDGINNDRTQNKSHQVGSFQWRDGPLLAALKTDNTWILLDELNLAPQSVLEGLNAILDHRCEVYIPELNKTFSLNKQTRIFACQNPLKQGGGRKGLPQSFLNRFTKVYLSKLNTDDLLHVVEGKYRFVFDDLKKTFLSLLNPNDLTSDNLFDIYKSLRNKQQFQADDNIHDSSCATPDFDLALRLVRFSEMLDRGVSTMEFGYKGGPYEINLRDILRWCDLLISPLTGFVFQKENFVECFDNFLLVLYEHMKLVYYQRMRCDQDKQFIRNAFSAIFQCDADFLNSLSEDVALYWTCDKIYVNDVVLERDTQPLRTQKPVECIPLLLESQREILKNIIECIHMEKPVLLCGSTDTGKTKIIDVLCGLSNQLCNSDNIDDSVTGSFQQIDLNRHLEEISHQVECIYLKFIQNTFLERSNSRKSAIDLLDSWNKYCVISNSNCDFQNQSDLSEELINYRRRIDNLSNVFERLISSLNSCSVQEDLEQLRVLQILLKTLKSYADNTDSLSTGGHFEWVDSKIVKSLKYGQYIVLEHVNLCSSAVLDRLNPVFEPNGNLMISEKGVSDNEQTEIVEKSKNFRAFLTIDPKNGELSRAMRNRCVELSLNKDSMSLDDKRIMVYHQGIHDLNIINSIISIHESISSLTEMNNFTISHLTKLAFLTASYKRIGYSIKRAIYISGMEVYVYPATTDLLGYGLYYYQNKLRDIVVMESDKASNLQHVSQQDYLRDVILNCNVLTEISMVKLQMVPLKIVLDNAQEFHQMKGLLSQVFSDFEHVNMEGINIESVLNNLIYMMYETSTMNDLRIRYLMLDNYLENQPALKCLSNILYKCIVEFGLSLNGQLSTIPWNTKLFPRIRDYSPDSVSSLQNNAFCLSATLIVHMLLQEIPHEPVTKLSQIDAITYSQAVARNQLTDKINNPFLQHFSQFLIHLQNVMKLCLKNAQMDLKSYTELITAVLWFNRILDAAKMNVYLNKEINSDLIEKLILHFKWLDKKLLGLVCRIFPSIETISPEFHNHLQKLSGYVASIKHPLNLRRKIYAKQLIEFQPYYQEEQIQFFMATQKFDQFLRVIPLHGHYTAKDIIQKFIAQNSDSSCRAKAIICNSKTLNEFLKFKEITLKHCHDKFLPAELKAKLLKLESCCSANDSSENANITSEDLKCLETELNQISQSLAQKTEEEEEDSFEMPNELKLNLLALREYFLVKSIITILDNPNINKILEVNSEYHGEIQFLNSTSLTLLNILKLEDYRSYRDIWYKLSDYINSIDNTQEFNELLKYLNGGYRCVSALQRLISNLASRLQLESLHNHPKCIQTLRSNDDIKSLRTYEGPSFINTISGLMFLNDGRLRSVPLCDLDMWKNSLEQLSQIVWHNSALMTPTYSVLKNNYAASQRNGKRLLLEVEYIEMLCNNVENENSTNYMQGFKKLINKLKEQFSELDDSQMPKHNSIGNQAYSYNTSLTNSLIGCIELCLITFTPLIDPVEKNRLKNKYIADDIYCLTNMTTAYDFTRVSMKYKNLGQEIYKSLEENLQSLRERQNKLKKKVALRPEKCLYTNLVKDITHFLTSNCDPQILFNLIETIQTVWASLNGSKQSMSNLTQSLENCEEVLSKIDLWIANSQSFVHHTLKPYSAYYQDILQPLQCSIDQLRFGFEGLKIVLIQVKNCMLQLNGEKSYANINDNGKLHKVLLNVIEFPSATMLNIFNVNSSKNILQNRCPVFSVLNKVSDCEMEYFHLLKAKLIELKNRANISQSVSQNFFEEFDFTFNIINQIWQQEEERRLRKQQEDDSLYLTKTKCQEEDEAQQELDEIDEMFPTTIQEDFGDFIKEDTLEKVINLDRKIHLKTKKASNVVKDEDFALIAKSFIDILIQNTYVYYYPKQVRSEKMNRLEFGDYFKERLEVFVRLYKNYKTSVNDCLDNDCFNSLFFSVAMQQKKINDELPIDVKQDKTYNFYKDANIQEIISCTDVLKRIEQRVDEQLALYPEHATLIDIKRIIKRICLLPSTASVVRFNTGFQILRQNVAQWNEVAHKNNNLKSEEHVIAEFVQKWTRMELQFWRNCLSFTYEKVESTAYKYWFFIYNLFHEYLAEREIDISLTDIKYTVKRFEEQESFDPAESNAKKFKVKVKDIIKILRQFVESSCYGDFHVRMQMLQAFELYLHNLLNYSQESSANCNDHVLELISGLRNLQLYFEQFANEIEDYKKSIKSPIEKKLKELVKIESYNKDLSYFSMRNNVSRVHRNLNKFLKEYEHQLRIKITPVFQPKDSTAKDYNFANDKGKDLRYDSKMKYYMIDAKYFVTSQKHKNNPTESFTGALLSKVQRLYNTSRNVVKETVTNAQYPKLIVDLDTLLTHQLERCDHLRNLSVDRTKERPKQKLEAKQILQQKRKGLTDLFKILSVLGVNYKTGLMELSLRSEFEDMSLPPFCIKAMLTNFKEKRLQPKLLQLNENLDVYFNKCVFKLKLLQNVMLTPLSELGPPNIERIKGCAIDLFLLVQNQRKLLALTTKTTYDYRVMLQQLRDLEVISRKSQIDETDMNFIEFRDRYSALKSVFAQIRYVFEQFKMFLSLVPSKCEQSNVVFSKAASTAAGIMLHKNASDFNALTTQCENILSFSKSTLNDLNKNNSEFLCKDMLNQYWEIYNQLFASIQTVIKGFETTSKEYLPIAKPLFDLSSYINDTVQGTLHKTHPQEDQDCDFENIDSELENIIHLMLLSLQKLYKKYPSKIQSDDEERSSPKRKTTTEDDNNDVQEQHLKHKLYEELKEDWDVMSIEQLNGKLMNILLTVKLSKPSLDKIKYIKKLLSVLPLLEQFNLMGEYYLCQQLGSHKVSVKMLSVILTVFVEIGTKGFCVPQDLMQDEDGDSKGDQKDKGEFGLEDGTGEKDASDKIESEDQLDDAKRPEDRQDEKDKDEKNDCKEEKGIDMSDDFDGEMQDIEKQEDEDVSSESDNEEDMSKEMGKTEEGAEKLDDQIWGDDEEPEQEEEDKEMDEEDGKGNNDEEDSHNDLNSKNDTSKDEGKDEHEKDGLDATNETNDEDKRKQEAKDIDDMQDKDKDQEQDQDQVNSYHNELEEPPEPEEFDLGDMNENDENEENDEQNRDDNPFDIDTMKENLPDPEETIENNPENSEEVENDTNMENGSDDSESDDDNQDKLKEDPNPASSNEEENEDDQSKEADQQQRGEPEKIPTDDEQENDDENKREDKFEEYEQSKDESRKEDNMQSVPELETKGSKDQLQTEQSDKDIQQEQTLDDQDTGEEKDGVGQAENESNDGGHQGIAETKETITQDERKNDTHTKEKRKQGQTDEDRSLGKAEKNNIKQLKTIDKLNEETDKQPEDDSNELEDTQMEADEYQHVKEPKSSDKLTLDNATEEQSKKIQHQQEEKKEDDNSEEANENQMDQDDIPDEPEQTNDADLQEIPANKLEKSSDNPSKSNQEKSNERAETQEQLEVEGEIVPTIGVSRNDDTTAYCNKELLVTKSGNAEELSAEKTLELKKLYQKQVFAPTPILVQNECNESWQTISNRMAQNARDLCEQLRLILEPTKCTRLKGDYRTGRRINMKKIIPYIASQFRKDKIWLRRTKPAQRDYKITIAIDDSKSMHHNNSKILTLEAISLVSQALTLLESGRLSVLSFGEQPQILLNHTEQFDGPKLVSSLQFSQDKTKIAELLDFIRTINEEEGYLGSDNSYFENLLLVLSDGRNIFSEGKSKVKNAIKLARLQRIFLVYIIIDNPENKNSILDIQTMEMLPDNRINIKSYLDDFPFPYYVIVRDLNQLPLVLSEAMRQWFELVSSEQ